MANSAPCKVLIVEDDPGISKFLRTTLTTNHYEALWTDTGVKALEMISSHCPDCILLDLGLPDLDGTEIIRRVVGDSKVMEVTSVTDPAQRLPMERALIDLGIYLIKERSSGLNGAAVTEEFRKILAEGRGTHGQNG